MTYNRLDIQQAAIGSVIAVIFFYLLRAGESIQIDPTKGLILGAVWLYMTSRPFINGKKETKVHAFGNIIVAVVVSSAFALMLNMATVEQLTSFQFFGSAAWLGTLLAVPAAQFFDRHNITEMYTMWYYKKRN